MELLQPVKEKINAAYAVYNNASLEQYLVFFITVKVKVIVGCLCF
jgi:hypothetical protein